MAKTERRTPPTTTSKTRLTAEVAAAVRAALDRKAVDVVVLDLRHTPAFTDFFMLCSGHNQRQVKAIADGIEEALKAEQIRPAHVEGYERAEWVLMDRAVSGRLLALVRAQGTSVQSIAGEYRNVTLMDWADVTRSHPDLVWADGIHLTPTGERVYASMVAAAAVRN